MPGRTELEQLVYSMSADIRALTKANQAALTDTERNAARIQRRFDRLGQEMGRNVARGADQLRNALAAVGVGLSVREIAQYSDTWTEARNKLAAAGVEMGVLAQRQDQLADLANRTRTAFEPTVDLYTKLTRAGAQLGASEEEIARATELVNKAAKAGGASVSEQTATILQLSQALSSGVLQGDELRSLRENAPLIAKAIADEFKTTIGGLKELGAEGKLTSDRVFKAILNNGKAIDAQFAKTIPTIADSLTRLQTEFGRYVNGANAASGASQQLAGFISTVADNFDMLADAAIVTASVIGGALAGQAIVRLVAGLATVTAGATGTAGAMVVLRAAMAFLGGPWGIAITAIGAALGYLALQASKSAQQLQDVERHAKSTADALALAAKYGVTAADTVKTLGGESSAAEPKVKSFAGAVDDLADKLYRLAQARKTEAVNALLAENAKAQADVIGLQRTQKKREARDIGLVAAAAGEGGLPASERAFLREQAARDSAASPEAKAIAERTADMARLQAAALKLMNTPLEGFVSAADKPARAGGGSGKTAKTPKTPADPRDTADERAAQNAAILADVDQQLLEARRGLVVDAQARAALEREILAKETAEQKARIDGQIAAIADAKGLEPIEKARRTAELEIAKLTLDKAAALKGQAIDREAADQLETDRVNLAQAELDGQIEALDIQAALAQTADAREAVELRILDLQIRRERIELESIAANESRTAAERELARRKLRELDATAGGRAAVIRDNNQNPVEAFIAANTSAEKFAETVQGRVVGAVDEMADGLARAAVYGENLGRTAKRVFLQMIADLLAAQLKKNIAQVALAFIPGFASGTKSAPGGLALVGEKGPELVDMRPGSKVYTNAALTAAINGKAVDRTWSTLVQQFHLHAEGAVMTEQLLATMQGMARRESRMAAGQTLVAAQAGAPGRQRSFDLLGT